MMGYPSIERGESAYCVCRGAAPKSDREALWRELKCLEHEQRWEAQKKQRRALERLEFQRNLEALRRVQRLMGRY